MSTYPDPEVLYPEVAAAGSLGAALQAAGQGLSFVAVSDSLYVATIASVVPHRAPLLVNGWYAQRSWSFRGESDLGAALIEGTSLDLAEIARVAQAWHDGVAVTDIPQVAPCVELTGRFEVPDANPARLIESEWRRLLRTAAEADWPEFHALIEAAFAEPALRQLYPFTSHWTLRFARRSGPDLPRDITVCLDVLDKGYVVTADWQGQVVGETSTAGEAVSLAVGQLPADLGPVAFGAAED